MKKNKGVALVEATIFMPLLLLCVIVGVQFYLMFSEYFTMIQTAREMVMQGATLVRPVGAGCGAQTCVLNSVTEADFQACISDPLSDPTCTYKVMCWSGEQVMNTRRISFLSSSYSLSTELAWYGNSGGTPLAPLLVKARVSGTFGGLFSLFGGIPISYSTQGGYLARFYGCGSDSYTVG